MRLRLVTPPASEPISLAEAKAFLRVEHAEDDALITSLIEAARQRAELIADSRQLITATWELVLPEFPANNGAIELPRPPLQSVSSLTYYDAGGNQQTLTEGSDYVVDTDGEPGRVRPAPDTYWPIAAHREDAVTVRFVAGYGDTGSDVPAGLRAGMLLWISHHYDNRQNPSAEVADMIFRQFRWGMLEGR